MTVLVTMTPENGGWVMRRWEKPKQTPWDDGRLRETHVAGVEGTMYAATAEVFRTDPPVGTRLGQGARE